MDTFRIQKPHFSVSYSRCCTFLEFDMSNLAETPTRRVEDLEAGLNPFMALD